MTIEEIENRFKQISNLGDIDLSASLIKKEDYQKQQANTDKKKSDQFGEVFTPLYLVDIMLYSRLQGINENSFTCDLCGGYGQFTIRLMRILYNKYHMNVEEWLKNQHTFTEIQAESCAKLIYIFGPDITLYCGDTKNITDQDEGRGIFFFNEATKKWEHDEWVDKIIQKQTIKNNKDYLTFVFNNYKDRNKLAEFLKSIKTKN